MHNEVREILSAELISITGAIIAGIILAFMTDKLYLVPGLLILLPGFLEMRGAVAGSLASRLSSGLFLGAMKPKIENSKVLRGNIIATFALIVMTSLVLGLVAYFAGLVFFGITSTKIIYVAIFAGVLSNILLTPVTIFLTFHFFRSGHDPNNVMGPYITTLGDVISVLSLYIALVIL